MNIILKILNKLLLVYPKKRLTNLTIHKLRNELGHLGSNARISIPIQTYGLENVFIGDNFDCGERLKLRTFSEWQGVKYSPKITIGNNVCIQSDCHISAINSVEIGDNVLMASFVYISDHQHGMLDYSDIRSTPPILRNLSSKGPVRIGNGVWIGEKATILPGVTIGECSIIGANSVVTKDIPPYCIACGNPAKVIKSIPK